MTGRLIDADALYTLFVKMKSFGELTAKKAIRCVEEAPTVDAEPVRHGRWNRFGFNGYVDYVCSECGVSQNRHQVEWGAMKYCPSCGAKMDAEEQPSLEESDQLEDLSEELLRAQGILEHFGEEVGKIAEELGKTLSEIAERFSDACNEYLNSEDDNDRKID